MQYAELAQYLGFSKYDPNGIKLLPCGTLLLQASVKSCYADSFCDRKLDYLYDGHIEGRRNSRNELVKTYINNGHNNNPRIILAVGTFRPGRKSGSLLWRIKDNLCIRNVLDKGLGRSPTFFVSQIFGLEWPRILNRREYTEEETSVEINPPLITQHMRKVMRIEEAVE